MTLLDRLIVEAFVKAFEFEDPILEIGSHQLKPGGDPNMDLRVFFPGRKYLGCDLSPGPGVGCVQDVTRLGIRDGSAGTVIMVSTIEHVFGIFDAFTNVARVLSQKGGVIVTSHMDCGIHAYPSDYWRFTPEAFLRLLDPFPAKLVGYQGLSYNPLVVFGVAFKGMFTDFAERAGQFRCQLEQSMRAWEKTMPIRHKITRFRRLASWRIFGSKDAYRKLRDEHVVGWHHFPACAYPVDSTTPNG